MKGIIVDGIQTFLLAVILSMVLDADGHCATNHIEVWGGGVGAGFVPPLTNILAIHAAYDVGIALKGDRSVVTWSAFPFGSAGAPGDLTNVVAVACGLDTVGFVEHAHYLALRGDGTVRAWGDNSFGQTNLPSTLSGVVAIAGGGAFSVALKFDGTVAAWGSDSFGQTDVPNDLSNVVAIASGRWQSVALRSDGTVVAWGGKLVCGGSTTGIVAPAGLSNVLGVAAGADRSYAILPGGGVLGWDICGAILTDTPTNLSNVVSLAVSYPEVLALTSAGSVVGWNDDAIIGKPPQLTNVVAVTAGTQYGLAVVAESGPTLHALMLNARRDEKGFSASISTKSGGVYYLEYKDSLTDSSWTALPLWPGNGVLQILSDPTATGTGRYYRVRSN